MDLIHLPLIEMHPEDDLAAYEALAAANMKPDDFYTAKELKGHLASFYVSAWWVLLDGKPIAWCGMNNTNEDWPGSCNFLGVVVDRPYQNSALANRLIRHIFKQAGQRPITTYIQPGVATERLLKPFGFREAGTKAPWVMHVCETNPLFRE